MAKETDKQSHLFAFTGGQLFRDGDPLTSVMTHDIPRMLNNLWRRVDVPVAYLQHPNHYLEVNTGTGGASVLYYCAQAPILVPPGSTKVRFTIGIKASVAAGATGSPTTTITNLKLYMSGNPYAGPGGPTAFDTTYLSSDHVLVTEVVNLVRSSIGETAYTFVEEFISPIGGLAEDGGNRYSWLVLAATVNGTASHASNYNRLHVHDFTAWVDKE